MSETRRYITEISGPEQATAIRECLDRVIDSEGMRSAPQLARFLRFVVEETLGGRAAELKGYTIATRALGRPDDFDPQIDPIVRVEAMRLRRVLDGYYAKEGKRDCVRIRIPRGTYVPEFLILDQKTPEPKAVPVERLLKAHAPVQRRLAPALGIFACLIGFVIAAAYIFPPAPVSRLTTGTVAKQSLVLPIVVIDKIRFDGAMPEWFSPTRFRLSVTDALARFDEIILIDREADPPSAVRAPAGRHVSTLTLSLATVGQKVNVSVQLIGQPDGRIIWSRRFNKAMPDQVPELASTIAAIIAQPTGVLFGHFREASDVGSPTRCIAITFAYWAKPNVLAHEDARNCLDSLRRGNPNLAVGHALASMIYLDEYRIGYNTQPAAIERSLEAARLAVALSSESPRAHQALMSALFASGDKDGALAAGAQASILNPADSEILADFSRKLFMTGNYSAGFAMLKQAQHLASGVPSRYDFFLFLAERMVGDDANSAVALSLVSSQSYAVALLGRAIVAMEAGEVANATTLISALLMIEPTFLDDPKHTMERWGMSDAIAMQLLEGLERAGLNAKAFR